MPVISIGNLSVGGTGKTPLTAWVVRHLQQAGHKPAILIRGYKAVEGQSDEALWLTEQTGALVIAQPDRVAAARAAVAAGAGVCVMDDGFQHLRLRRNLDIVCLDATCPFGYGHLLPAGLLREPPQALQDAQVVVITRCEQVAEDSLTVIREAIAKLSPRAIVAEAAVRPVRLVDALGDEKPAAWLASRRVWAFCGLGNPDSFYRTLEMSGAKLVGRSSFDDHHVYTAGELTCLWRQAFDAGADLMLTTAKDWVKLSSLVGELPIRRLDVEVDIVKGCQQFLEVIHRSAALQAR